MTPADDSLPGNLFGMDAREEERRARLVTAEQWHAGYREKLGNAVYARRFELIERVGPHYLVREPVPEEPLYRLDFSTAPPAPLVDRDTGGEG